MYYTLTRLYYDITFWAIGTSINDITIVIALKGLCHGSPVHFV